MAALRAPIGRFILLEGPDGSGTTTHATLLSDALRGDGDDVVQTAEPTDGPVGAMIRNWLRTSTAFPDAERQLPPDALQLLFIADRAQHVAQVINPALSRGQTVVCDRYTPSTIAYGAALGLDEAWLESCNARFVRPTVSILLLPPVEVCLERLRGRATTDALEREETQRKVHAAYLRYAKRHPDTIVIDSSAAPSAVAEHILAAVRGEA